MDASPGGEELMQLGLTGEIAIGLITGLLVGAFHFALLWWNTQLFASGSAGKAIALQLGRITVAVGVLVLLARLGFVALLCGGFGFLVARPLLVWRFGALR
jgi:F1F0 ATPase subunit 2